MFLQVEVWLVSLFNVHVNSFASRKLSGRITRKAKAEKFSFCEIPIHYLPQFAPFAKITTVSTIHLVLGKDKYFCSQSTSSLPPSIKSNRWWKLISLFPSPTQETLIYFLLCVGNTKDESYYSGWAPTKSPPCSTTGRIWPSARPQTTAKSRRFCDRHEAQLLTQVVSLTFWCWWTFLFSCTPFVFLLVGLGASIPATHTHRRS